MTHTGAFNYKAKKTTTQLLNNGSILLDDNFEDKSSKEIELIFRKTLGYGDM